MSSCRIRAKRGKLGQFVGLLLLIILLTTGPLLARGRLFAAAVSLSVLQQPAGAVAGTAFTQQPGIQALNSDGSVDTSFTGAISIAIRTGTGTSGATLSGTTTVTAVNGVATFDGLSIDKAGSGYVLTASSGALTPVDTSSFSVATGPATKLAFTTQPGASNTAGAAFATQPVVIVQDGYGNTVTTSTAAVTVAITSGTGTSGATLSGTTTVTAVNGVSTFSGLSINLPGTGYTLTATSSGLTSATSNTLNVAGEAAKLAFTTQPAGATAGLAFTTQPVVVVQDANGNTVTISTASVTVAITPGTGISGATLSGTTTVTAVNGIATFNGLSIDKAGTGYKLTVSSGSLITAASNSFTVAPGAAVKLAFITQPSASNTAGAAFAIQPVALVQDTYGNTVTTSAASVTAAITSGTGTSGATLLGTTTVTAVNGVVTFSGLSVDKAGTGYTLTVSSWSLITAISSSFTVAPGAATKLAFTTQPSASNTAGAGFATQPVVTAQDGYGNTATTSAASVTVAITSGTGTSGATLSGTTTVTAVNGVVTFSGLSINLPGTGYTLTATSSGLTSATSNALNVAGAGAKLAFTTQPSASNTAGIAFYTQPVVTIQDASGNTVTTSTAAVTVAITSGTGTSGATLSGTTTVTAVNGVATFSDLSIDKAGTGYTLTVSSGSLITATSSSFTVASGGATKLVFTTQPSTSNMAGTAFGTQPVVTIQDASGNTVTTSTVAVTVAITSGTGASGAILSGTTTVIAVNGVATFSGLSIDKAGTGYRLTVSSWPLITATSSSFTVAPGGAAKLAFTTQPSASNTAGAAFATQPVVTAQDGYGNTVTTSAASVTVAITFGTGTIGAILSGTKTVGAVNGMAIFSGLSIDKAGTGYTLTATSSGLTSATSNALNVAGAAVKLAFTTQPSASNTAGAAFGTQPVVTIQDANSNTVTTSTAAVTLAITLGKGTSGAILLGTKTMGAVNGVATFSGLSIDKAGTGYTLTATSGTLTSATSSGFNVVSGQAAKLAFTTQPSASNTAGTAFGTQPVVTIQDASGNTVTTSTTSVTVAITSGTGTSGATLSGTKTVGAVNGMAIFSGLSIDKAGTGYTLRATSGTLTSATSSGLNVISGPAAKLTFTTQPSASNTAGTAFGPQPVVTIQDANSNTVTTSTAAVTLAITLGKGTSGAALLGTKTMGAVNGVATFSGLGIDKAGTGYTLTATSGTLTSATSSGFNVVFGPAAKVAFTTQPSASNTAGTIFGTQPVVTIQDASGNTVTTSTTAVTLAITFGTGTSGATLLGTKTVGVVNGMAIFSGLSIDKAGTGYTLTATSGTLTSATSSGFNVVFGPAAKVAFTTQPSASNTAGTAFGTQPVVTIQDANGNTVTTSTTAVTLAITLGTGTSGATLSGTKTMGVVNGMAIFSGLSIDKAGTGYMLTASSWPLIAAASSSLTVAPGVAAKVAFTTQPSASNTAGTTFGRRPVVTIQDANGNTVITSTSTVTLAITSGTGTSGATLSGTKTVGAVNGMAIFSGLSIDKAGTGYTLTATSYGLTSAASNSLNVAEVGANLAPTTTTVASNSATYSNSNQRVKLMATVAGSTVNEGKVTFTVKDSGGKAVGSSVSGKVKRGQASATYVLPGWSSAGSYTIEGVYSGGNVFLGSDSSGTLTVKESPTTTMVSSSANHSVSGQSVIFTARVTSRAGTPTGTVIFNDEDTTLGTGSLNSSGRATYAISSLSVGTHFITAVYNGDSNFNGSTSSPLSQRMNKANTTTRVYSSSKSSVFGQSVTFTATVSVKTPGSGTPTGMIQFRIDRANFGSPVALSSGSAASGSIPTLSLGRHSITAVYSGDSNFNGSASSSLSQGVK